jgi:hypothetical protein
MSEHETELLGAYVLRVLDPAEDGVVREHLDGCADCQREVDDLREMEAALGAALPEIFIEGPPADGDLLLQRTLRAIRTEEKRDTRQRRTGWIAAAAAAAVVLAGAGAVVGRSTAPATSAAQPAPSATAVPGSRTVSATDPVTQASMTVTLKPAQGWVRLSASVSGIPAGQQCRVFVVARDGTRREAGSWLVSEAGAKSGTSLDSFAMVPLPDVAAVQVETFAGQTLVNVPA